MEKLMRSRKGVLGHSSTTYFAILLSGLAAGLAPGASVRADPTPAGVTAGWLDAVRSDLVERSLAFAPATDDRASATNTAQGLGLQVGSDGIEIREMPPASPDALASLSVVRFGRGNALEPVGPGRVQTEGARAEIHRDALGLVEWYENSVKGVEHGFSIERPPGRQDEGQPVVFELALAGALRPSAASADQIALVDASGATRLTYDALVVWDARSARVPAQLELAGGSIQIRIDDSGASYPLDVDPLLSDPSVIEGSQQNSLFGISVATAGDVNGDGFSDVIVGASSFVVNNVTRGQALIFLGGPNGLSTTAAWNTEGSHTGAAYGAAVASAGDVNADGFDDVLVSEPYFASNNGSWRIYLGGDPQRPDLTPRTTPLCVQDIVNQPGSLFGASLGTAGDVNGDGFADVVVGAPGANSGHGQVDVYLGPTLGAVTAQNRTICGTRFTMRGNALVLGPDIQSGGEFGGSVGTAGDVNDDGFDDIVVGAPGFGSFATPTLVAKGRAYVFQGTDSPITPIFANPLWTLDGTQANGHLGKSVGTAGDVNGDGFSDIVIGAPDEDFAGVPDAGVVRVFSGPPSGTQPLFFAVGEASGAHLGASVATVGDVNGDGLADVAETGNRFARVFLGAQNGFLDGNGLIFFAPASSAAGALTIATAGDVNGDGFSDVVVGDQNHVNGQGTQTGGVFLFMGKGETLAQNPSLTALNSIYSQAGAGQALGLGFAGDIDHDGFSDFVTGAPFYSNGQTNEGRFTIHYGNGSPTAHPIFGENEGNQAGAQLGWNISGAGDVNGDGFDDVIIGAPGADTPLGIFWLGPTVVDAGTALVYYGSASGLQIAFPALPSFVWLGLPGAQVGYSVASAGDVNGDGCGDVIVGAPFASAVQPNSGKAALFLGCANGPGTPLGTTPAWIKDGVIPNGRFGIDVASAGDVNGDGRDDVIIGADGQDVGGAAFVYLGRTGGLEPTPVRTYVGAAGSSFGQTVAGVGDIDGNGFSDIAIAAPTYTTSTQLGMVRMYLGASGGPSAVPSATLLGELPPPAIFHRFGSGLAGAGDVNGDGFGDLIVGDQWFSPDVFTFAQGKAYLFHGGTGGSLSVGPTFRDCPTAFCDFGRDIAGGHDVNADGFPDVLIGAYQFQGEGAAFLHLGNGARVGPALFGNHPGALVLPRQGATVGSSNPPLALRGVVPEAIVDATIFARSPAGRTKAALELETKPLLSAFDGLGTSTLPFADTLTSGVSRRISRTIPVDGGPMRWRARIRSASPLFGRSRWISLSGNAPSETDFRSLLDSDQDGINAAADLCPSYAQTTQTDTDGDGRGDECECGDQNGDGLNDVRDIVAINSAIFNPSLVTPLCDANKDGNCNVSDIVAVNVDLFTPINSNVCARQPVTGP